MKTAGSSISSESEAKRCHVSHDSFAKWQREYDREWQTLSLLDCESGLELNIFSLNFECPTSFSRWPLKLAVGWPLRLTKFQFIFCTLKRNHCYVCLCVHACGCMCVCVCVRVRKSMCVFKLNIILEEVVTLRWG